jgi:hypothetical protein
MMPHWSADANSSYLTADHREEIMDWLRGHHVDAPEDVRRVDVYGPVIYIRQLKCNNEGKLYLEDGEPAERRYLRWLRRKPPSLELP